MLRNENYGRHLWVGLALTLMIIAGLTFAWLSEPSRMAQAGAATNKAGVQLGRKVYVDNCTACHGTRGEGGVGLPLNSKALLTTATNDTLAAIISVGRPNTIMPAWAESNGGPLTDQDIRDVVSFIRAWEPNAPTVVTTTVPSAARGLAVFNSTCFICHGENGQDGKSPAINDTTRLSQLNDDWYRQTINNGRPAKGMPSWSTIITPTQVDDLIALIGAWRKSEPISSTATVAGLLDQALFTLSQNDAPDTLFYLNRAKPIAFGPALARFDPIQAEIEAGKFDQAMSELSDLRKNWPIGDAAQGQIVFKDVCQGCHGAEGQGGVGRRLKPNTFIQQSTNADVLSLLFTGRAGTAMRGFTGQLTEQQLADAIAFLRTWQQ